MTVVDAAYWQEATRCIAASEVTLLSLWGEPGRVHMAVLDSGVVVLSLDCPDNRYPSVGELHAPAIRLERELLNARILIEGEIAAEAAQRATAEDLVEIAGTLQEMESIIARGEHSRNADQRFHVSIARASGNDVLASIVGELWAGMFSPLFHQFSERTRLVRRQDAALSEHRAIYAALRTHDAIGARTAMRHHLMQVQAVLADAELSKD